MDSFVALHAIDRRRFGIIATMLQLAEGHGLETIDQSTEFNKVLLRVACDFLCTCDQLYHHCTHITEAPLSPLHSPSICI